MYLSRLMLNPRSRAVRRDVANPYQMHRTIMRAFPDQLGTGMERVLFRLETQPRTGALTLLVQSLTSPNWAWLAEPNAGNYLLATTEEPNPGVKFFQPVFAADQVLVFRLRANPTIKRKFDSGDHKRIGIYDEDKQIAWLVRKGEHGGFQILSVRTRDCGVVRAVIPREDARYQAEILGVQFDGVLKVTDPAKFQETIRQGIGSGKGLGFGLLSVAKFR